MVILAFGSAFAVQSNLGVSPMGAIPYVLSHIINHEFFTIGMISTIKFLLFIALQVIILRKDYKLIDSIQIIFAFIFGFVFDFAIWTISSIAFPFGYIGQLVLLLVSIVLIGIGLTFMIAAKIVPMPPEALCLAINKRWQRTKFHIVKMSLDSTLVLIALSLSLIALGGVYGVREGTIIAALAIGKIIPLIRKIFAPIIRRIN